MRGVVAGCGCATAGRGPAMPRQQRWGPDRWRPLNVPATWQEIGVYGAAILSQFPARVDGLQRDCVVGSFYPGWTVPGPTDVPVWLRTQYPVNIAGAQRYGSTAPQGVGPIAARKFTRRVTAAQIAQSGLAVQSWVTQIRQWS